MGAVAPTAPTVPTPMLNKHLRESVTYSLQGDQGRLHLGWAVAGLIVVVFQLTSQGIHSSQGPELSFLLLHSRQTGRMGDCGLGDLMFISQLTCVQWDDWN